MNLQGRPNNTRIDRAEAESSPGSVASNSRYRKKRNRTTRRDVNGKKSITDSPFGDGYRWRKYGEKMIRNAEHPRCYYRCTYDGCNATKHVQRVNSGGRTPEYEVTLCDEHTCNNGEHFVEHLVRPSTPPGARIISFESSQHSSSAMSASFPQTAAALDISRPGESRDLISPPSPAGQFFGSDATAYGGVDETFDPFSSLGTRG